MVTRIFVRISTEHLVLLFVKIYYPAHNRGILDETRSLYYCGEEPPSRPRHPVTESLAE
jgi:hypothetical protein